MEEPPGDAHAVWEEHYSATPQVWSGRVNARLAEVAPTLAGGRVLDLGCGDGALIAWLRDNKACASRGVEIDRELLQRAIAARAWLVRPLPSLP